MKYRVVYDPREPKEDEAVWAALVDLEKGIERMTPGTGSRLLDVNITSKSEDEIGLQLADLAAGETRAFLDANKDLLDFEASPKLITPRSDEPVQGVLEFNGRTYKVNAVTMMSGAFQKRFFQKDPKERSVTACFTDVLMCGMITCFGSWGTPRHIAPYDRMLIDQLD